MERPTLDLIDVKSIPVIDGYIEEASAYFNATGDSTVYGSFIYRNRRPIDPEVACHALLKISNLVDVPLTPIRYQSAISAAYSYMNTCSKSRSEQISKALCGLEECLSEYKQFHPVEYWNNKHCITVSLSVAKLNLALFHKNFAAINEIAASCIKGVASIEDSELFTFAIFNISPNIIRVIAFYIASISACENFKALSQDCLELLKEILKIPLMLDCNPLPSYIDTVLHEWAAANVIAFNIKRFSRLVNSPLKGSPTHAEALFVLLCKAIRPEGSNVKNKLLYEAVAEYCQYLGLTKIGDQSRERLADFWDKANGYYSAAWRDAD